MPIKNKFYVLKTCHNQKVTHDGTASKIRPKILDSNMLFILFLATIKCFSIVECSQKPNVEKIKLPHEEN